EGGLIEAFIDENELWSIHAALANVHFPRSTEALESARRRFIFQELLVLQLALATRKHQLESSARAEPITTTAQIDARIRRLFEFELTDGQERAIKEIVADMDRTIPMNRLLQGDVGSGKTMVAIYAMLVATAQGFQAALMAPTEVLARQHYQTLSKALAQARVKVALWTGQLTAAERRETQAQIESGEVNLVVGTQALIHSDCDYAKLGLVVIDEQHKFGVQQRARLRDAAAAPHYLVMTATPIPRTVAMTAFGDLDVSTLRDHPPGRQEVKSYLVKESESERWWEFFRKQLRQGRQGFVVTPRLNESESQDVMSVEESFEALCNGELEEFRLQLIHGRMTTEEKQEVMDSFRSGETQVLVSTTVIEVGVDVPNASVMTIESADRFGLAQLHQLRGRVGRGNFGGFVGVFSENVDDYLKRKRLEAFVSTSDGFELAELDFQLRGPGDLMGTKQHGLPPLRIADLVRDEDVLVEARKLARSLVEEDRLAEPEFAGLLRQVMIRYGQKFELGDVG
ncbi:MAG: ATP-dependent DNA helicase RecG, partial [Planctomycetota bacterium]